VRGALCGSMSKIASRPASYVCTMLLTRRATYNFDAATKCDEDENEEDEQGHRMSTTDEASCVGDGKETGGEC